MVVYWIHHPLPLTKGAIPHSKIQSIRTWSRRLLWTSPQDLACQTEFLPVLCSATSTHRTNWNWSRFSSPNWIIHIAIRFWNNFVFMSNNTACHHPLQGWLVTPWSRSITIPNYPTTSAISLSFGPDQPTCTICYTDLEATPKTNLKSPSSSDPIWPPWLCFTSCIATVDNLTNHIAPRPRHWWQRPSSSKEDTNHLPTSRCNYILWALYITNHTGNGYVNSFMNIRVFFLGFTFRPQ